MKIDNSVFLSYLRCPYKGNLLLEGRSGQRSDYETLIVGLDRGYKPLAQAALYRGCTRVAATPDPADFVFTRRGPSLYKFDTKIEHGSFECILDALKAEPDGPHGEARYTPAVFCRTERVPYSEELRLAFGGYVLGQVQGSCPATGIVVHGPNCSLKTVQLTPKYPAIERIVAELVSLATGQCRSPLILNSHCRVCEFQQRCKDEAKKQDNLSLLHRMTEKTIRQYNHKGIFTVNQLSYTFHPRRKSKRAKARGRPHSYPLQAMAIRDQKVYVLDLPVLASAATQAFIDMEGDPDGGFVYLIGLLVVRDGQETYYSFWADTRDDEPAIFERLNRTIAESDDPQVFHYGPYEARVLKRAASCPAHFKLREIVGFRLINVLSEIYSKIYFPTYTNSLKDIAAYLKYNWRTPGATGLDAMVWRNRWESSRDETLKQRLIEYNQDDCHALERLTTFLLGVEAAAAACHSPATKSDVISVDALDDGDSEGKHEWGKKEFAIPEFEAISRCAYFDYQRSKVFIRTNPALRQIRQRQRKSERKPSYRATSTVEFRVRKCPHCKSAKFCQDGDRFRAKLSLDLKLSRAGIARRVTRCWSKVYRCSACGRPFVSRAYTCQERFGHSLAAWAIHQHLANRITFENLETTVRECFHLPLNFRQIYKFKARFAQFYDRTYRRILEKLISGPLLHVDETKVNLMKGNCYVWVFTNMEEVAFILRPDRNAAFLHELLRGFHGVLVSDFFSGYDSLKCPQQKCLVHLMRDFNDGVLADPLDQELKELGQRFGHLLQAIIATVDRFGLKARRLGKHKPAASRFFASIEPVASDSEAARKLKKRITKYRGKLFTFLDYDGVPWNNNNAEHAVKHFAKYRRLANGRFSENGLKDYLKLLSIFETCKYKAVSFLEFLLSKERDIDSFAART
jgi:predicted RecB family nuclease